MNTVVNAARITSLLAVLAVLGLAAPAQADHHSVKVADDPKLGGHLVDAKGMTLYVFKKDAPGKSACVADCVAKWPIFYRESVGATGSLEAGDFGTITREDGQKQTTYKGLPLYYFAADKAPGEAAGQGVREVWYVLVTWLSRRLGRELRVPSLQERGLALVGGRLVPGELDRPAAQLMYETARGERVTLFLRALGAGAAPTAFRFVEDGGASTFYWVDGDWGYALTGALDRARLLDLATTVYAQLGR